MKIEAAGLPVDPTTGAFADDAFSREGIIEMAIERAIARYGVESVSRVVSIGDGKSHLAVEKSAR